MSITYTIEERAKARKGSSGHEERLYKILADSAATLTEKNAITSQDIITAIKAETTLIPTTLASSVGVAMTRDDTNIFTDEAGPGLWYAQVQWKLFDTAVQPPDNFTISFDISSTNLHITQSRGTVFKKGIDPSFEIDFGGAINVDEDGTVNGTDITVPALSFELNYTKPGDFVSQSYLKSLLGVVATTNQDDFHEFLAGTLILSKVSGKRRVDSSDPLGYVWDLQYGFSASENETSLKVGSITGIQKKGWEYLWVYYATYTKTVGSVKRTVKTPVCAYVEEVYKKSSYSLLGI